MTSFPPFKPCPCTSGRSYAACCGPRHSGERPAETARDLMRSRYSAYVLRLEPYLLRTWHPRTRPDALGLDDSTRWTGLTIRRARDGEPQDQRGEVTFEARYQLNGTRHVLRETSVFERQEGHWVYVDGEVS